MSLRDHVRRLVGRWPFILVGILLGMSIGWSLVELSPAQYSASTILYLSPGQANNDPVAAYQGTLFSDQRIKSYAQLVTSRPVLDDVIRQMRLSESPDTVAGKLSATPRPNTVLLIVTGTDSSPTVAADLANAAASSLTRLVPQLERPPGQTGPTPVTIQSVQAALPPSSPVTAPRNVYLVLGAICGLLVGLGVAALRDALNNTVRSADRLQDVTGVPVLGAIPSQRRADAVLPGFEDSPRAEAYRWLRTNLRHTGVDLPGAAILVVSAVRGEGRSTLVANLAVTLASAGDRVLVVDADLRLPSLPEYLGVDPRPGLTDALAARVPAQEAVQRWSDGLFDVLASGTPSINPGEVASSQQLADLLEELRRRYDVVLLDAPPLLEVADAAELAAAVDAVLLACRYGHTTYEQVNAAADALSAVSGHLVGTVLTNVPDRALVNPRRPGRDGSGESTAVDGLQLVPVLRPSRQAPRTAGGARHGVHGEGVAGAAAAARSAGTFVPAAAQSSNHHAK